MTRGGYVSNLDGLHAMHEARRARKRQRDLGLCCRDGSCDACCSEGEAIKEAREEW